MIKQGFISDQTLSFSPSRTTTTATRVYSPASSPTSNTLLSPPASPLSSSPAPTQPPARPAHSQTLYEMMSDEQHRESRLSDEKRRKLHDRVARLLDEAPFRNAAGDVRLAVVGRDGFRVSMDVHKSVLAEKSRFFAEKLRRDHGVFHSVEISDCDDVDVYVEAVLLMYCEDLKRRLTGEDVSRVLGLLKVQWLCSCLALLCFLLYMFFFFLLILLPFSFLFFSCIWLLMKSWEGY